MVVPMSLIANPRWNQEQQSKFGAGRGNLLLKTCETERPRCPDPPDGGEGRARSSSDELRHGGAERRFSKAVSEPTLVMKKIL